MPPAKRRRTAKGFTSFEEDEEDAGSGLEEEYSGLAIPLRSVAVQNIFAAPPPPTSLLLGPLSQQAGTTEAVPDDAGQEAGKSVNHWTVRLLQHAGSFAHTLLAAYCDVHA